MAGAAGCLGSRSPLADEGPPETTTIRLAYYPNNCLAPLYGGRGACCARRASPISATCRCRRPSPSRRWSRGEVDFANTFAGTLASSHGRRRPITALAGVHSGCYELFAHEPIRTISELRGKRVGIQDAELERALLPGDHGRARRARPRTDIDWVTSPDGNPMELFAEGKADAFLGFPPEPQELRARKIGHVIISTPSGQAVVAVFLLHAVRQPEFVRDHPIATKRYLRAVLKAADYCATSRRGRAASGRCRLRRTYEYALQTLTEIPYDRWRDYDPRTRCGSTRCGCTRRA